jgi:hypothetical protein
MIRNKKTKTIKSKQTQHCKQKNLFSWSGRFQQ